MQKAAALQTPALEERLGHVAELLVRWVRRVPLEADLDFPAAAVLAVLGREGPLRLTALARVSGLTQPGTTQLVTRLERDGLVRRAAAPDDGRAVLVEVTAAGDALMQRRRTERAGVLAALLDGLDDDDRTRLAAALPALERLADAALAAVDTPTLPTR